MFKVGQSVSHPVYGGCTVVGVTNDIWKGITCYYYKLKPAIDAQSNIYMPIETATERGLRNVISKDEAEQLLRELPSIDSSWQADTKKRKQAYHDAIQSQDIRMLAAIVKTYYCTKAEKYTSTFDREILMTTKNRLFSELALALDIAAETVEELFVSKINIPGLTPG